MGKDIDKLRQQTGIDKLGSKQRQKLFKDFVDHGGRVIHKRDGKGKIKRPLNVHKAVQEQVKEEKQKRETVFETPPHKKPAVETTPGEKAPEKRKKKNKISDALKIYLKGLLQKIFTLSGNKFSDSFINHVDTLLSESLVDIYASINSILRGENSVKDEILRLSTGENSIFYEILVRLNALYDEVEFLSIEKYIKKKNLPDGNSLPLFKQFFKRFYILGQNADICKLYVKNAVEIQGKRKNIRWEIISSVKEQLKNDIDILLGDVLRKFHIVLCRLDRSYYPLYSQMLDEFLAMTEQDKIGYITQEVKKKRIEELKRQREYLKRKQLEIQEKRFEDIKIPKHVERGMPLLKKALEEFEQKMSDDARVPFLIMDKDDKMYTSAVLFEVFESEYSFILTTGKIKFNIDYKEQKKIDIKEDLNHAYLLLSETREEIKDYVDIVREMKKTDDNMRLTVHQKSSIIEALSKKRSMLSKDSRARLAEVMKAIENTLSIVINDYNSSRRLLQNPDEELYFDTHIDGEKKLHSRRNIEAVCEVFLFASTLAFLINFGELSGSGIYTEPDKETEPSKRPFL
jgi:hypothetical protein